MTPLNIYDEVEKNINSTIGTKYTNADVIHIWNNIAKFVETCLCEYKGVNIKDFGMFTLSEWKLGIGNHKFIHRRHPIFVISEKLLEFYNLKARQLYTSGKIPTQMLNLAAIAKMADKPRAMVADCVHEIIQAFSRLLSQNQDIEFRFSQIGGIQIIEKQVHVNFEKDFLKRIDNLHQQCGGKDGQLCGKRPKDPKL